MKYPSYPKYKDSGVEWLGEVPEHWEVKRGRFCMSVNPRANRLRALGPDDEVSFVPMEAVGEYGGLRLDGTKPLGDIGTGYTEFQDNDVVVAKITPCFENGKGALAGGLHNGVAMGTTELHVLRAMSSLNRNFLFYISISSFYRKTGESEMYGAGGQKRVPPEFNKNFSTPLPSISEQQAIATFLDAQTTKIDTLIAKKRELIDKLKEKRAALITRTVTRGLPPEAAKAAGLDPNPRMKDSGVEWLGEVPEHWEVGKLKHFWSITDCKHVTAEFVDDGIPLVSIKEVQEKFVCLDSAKSTTLEFYNLLVGGGRKPVRGDIIYSRNATVGKASIVDTEREFAMGQDVCLLRSRASHTVYCYMLLQSQLILSQLESVMIGSTFKRINVDDVKNFIVTFPPVLEQPPIADYLDLETAKLDALTTKVESAIERLQEYRSALITAAVTGKIDVREAMQ